jgi:hypothetical protein
MKARLSIGKPAPDVTVHTLEGTPAALGELWGNGRSLLLIFLRHLA